MAGLLDMFGGDPQSQGLLAAAAQILQASGPSTRPTSFGQILGGGVLAGQQATQQARQQAQLEQMRGLQLQEAQASLAAQQRALAKQGRLDAAAQGAYRSAGAQAASLPGGPTAANAERIGDFQDGFDTDAYIDQVMAIDPAMGFQLRQSMKKVGPKYDSGITFVNGPDGRPVAVRTADDGSIKQIDGLAPREKLQLENLGGRSVAVNPYDLQPGQDFQRTATPDALISAATQRRGQDITMRGQDMVDRRAVSSNPANKPLPAAALKMQQSELDALSTASGIDGQLSRIQGQLDAGTLSFGPVSNLVNQARNAAGWSTDESRNQASFRSTLEKLRNDSLRLNAGVQTDGDAQRAWNELFTNLNDTDLVRQRLGEIRGINQRAAQIRRLNVDGIRANYGHEALDTSQYEQPTGTAPQAAPAPRAAASAAAGNKTVSLADITETARKSGRSTAEVTAALRAKGYTIGGK